VLQSPRLPRHSSGADTRAGEANAAAAADQPSLLFQEYALTRDVQLRNRLVLQYVWLVQYVTRRLKLSRREAREDIVQVSYVALIAAVERYDPDRGVKFLSFALPTIIGEIKHYLRDQCWPVKPPRALSELAARLPRLADSLERELGRPADLAELAASAGVSEERCREAMVCRRTGVAALEDGALGSGLPPGAARTDPALRAIEDREALERVLRYLTPLQRRVIQGRFFEGRSQAVVAERLGLSQVHVGRLERQAIERLRTIASEPASDC
jgi:RNA polymerase sigma-B factor